MVHRIDAVRGDIHFKQGAIARSQVEDAFDGNTAQCRGRRRVDGR